MKKYLLMFVAASMLSTTASFAQKVAEDSIKSGLAKADEAAQHAKKGLKASTWTARGDAYVSALQEPTKALYLGLDVTTFPILCGSAVTPENMTVNGKEYAVYKYPYFWAYAEGGKVVSWELKKPIDADALDKALESFAKAVELEPASAEKVKGSLDVLVNYYKLVGSLEYALGDAVGAAEAYLNAVKVQESPTLNDVDPSLLYYVGYMYTVDGSNDVSSYKKGEENLLRAKAAGINEVEDANADMDDKSRGNLYYYLYNCAYGLKEGNSQKLQDAKAYLIEGIEKYPLNEGIFEGLLQLYTAEEGLGDPSELLEPIEKKIATNNDDLNAWFARGRVYYALKQYDECITSFKRVVEIDPAMFAGHFYLGLFYMLAADDYLIKINGSTYTDQASYNADIVKLNGMYAEAVAPFEKAYELEPTDENTLTYLKQLCFRLRDEDGMMDKYTKYNTLLSQLPR